MFCGHSVDAHRSQILTFSVPGPVLCTTLTRAWTIYTSYSLYRSFAPFCVNVW